MNWISWVIMLGLSWSFYAQAQTDEQLEMELEASKDLGVEKPTKGTPPVPAIPPATVTPSASSPAISEEKSNPIPSVQTRKTRSLVDQEAEIQGQILKMKNGGENPLDSGRSLVDQETERQNRILRRKRSGEEAVSADRNQNRFPVKDPYFKLPQGPPQGGAVRVEHPRAAEGLVRINRDGSYQYKTKLNDKSQSSSLKVTSMSPPVITSSESSVTYRSMYGDSNLTTISYEYEWSPIKSWDSLSVQLGVGLTSTRGNGTFKQTHPGRDAIAEESYNLFIVPVSTFLVYRFQFSRKQWIVPFLSGGITYYGMAEIRDDGDASNFAGAPAAGGGGGLLLSISRLDSLGAFTLSQEYGVSDMWLVLEARSMTGLYDETDFTNQSFSAGIAIDF